MTSLRRDNRHVVAVVLGGSSAGSRDARMRTLLDQYFKVASDQAHRPDGGRSRAADSRTARRRSRPGSRPEPKATQRYEVASAVSTPIRLDPARDRPRAEGTPTPGSTDPIRPVMVKTLNVKPGAPGAYRVIAAVLADIDHARSRAARGQPRRREAAPLALAKAEPAPAPAPVPALRSSSAGRRRTAAGSSRSAPFRPSRKPGNVWSTVKSKAANLLGGADPFTETVHKGDSVALPGALCRARPRPGRSRVQISQA